MIEYEIQEKLIHKGKSQWWANYRFFQKNNNEAIKRFYAYTENTPKYRKFRLVKREVKETILKEFK